MQRKIFINGYFGYYNLGDDLMIKSLMSFLSSKHSLYLLTKNNYYKHNIHFINRFNLIKLFLLINKDDQLFNLGGVSQDKTGSIGFYYYFLINLIFLIKKAQIIFINSDFIDIKKNYNKKVIHYLLNKSKIIIVRNKIDYNYYKKTYSNVYYLPDIIFTLNFKISKKPIKSILLSLKYKYNYKELIRNINQNKQSINILKMKNEKLNQSVSLKKIIIYNYNNLNKIISLIYNSKKIITMHYHIAILGILFRKPVYLIKTNEKLKSLIKDFSFKQNTLKNFIDNINKINYIYKSKSDALWKEIFNKISNF